MVLKQRHFEADVLIPIEGEQVINDCEIARRLRVAVHTHALVDRRKVIQHGIRRLYSVLEKLHYFTHIGRGNPGGGNLIASGLANQRQIRESLLNLVNDVRLQDWQFLHTSSTGRSVLARCRCGRFRSRNEGMGARSTPCGPTTQLKGRRSSPTACCSKSKPSINASGRGGQPGTYTSTGRNLSTTWTTL